MIAVHLGDVHLRGEQLGALGRVDAVEAAVPGRRAGDPHMDLAGAGLAHHLHDLEAGRAADDRIVDQDDALALDQRAVGIVLELDAEVADLVARLDEGAADIMRADDAELERDAALLGVADRRGHARIGHRHDIIGLDRALDRQLRRRSACGRCRPSGRRSRCPAARNRYARRCRAGAAAARTGGASARPGRRPRSARRARPSAR